MHIFYIKYIKRGISRISLFAIRTYIHIFMTVLLWVIFLCRWKSTLKAIFSDSSPVEHKSNRRQKKTFERMDTLNEIKMYKNVCFLLTFTIPLCERRSTDNSDSVLSFSHSVQFIYNVWNRTNNYHKRFQKPAQTCILSTI